MHGGQFNIWMGVVFGAKLVFGAKYVFGGEMLYKLGTYILYNNKYWKQ